MIEIRKLKEKDIETALKIYNSNKEFLIHHIGSEKVDYCFLSNELNEMVRHDFTSNLVIIDDEPVGIIDYSLNDSGYVYLSLLMLLNNFQNKGLGTSIYLYFESLVGGKNASKIRIDVVDDYENNVIPFWEKMGFIRTKKEELTWGGKTSSVTVMEKSIS
ncbi:MAG: GNAT family N-acetyltransferase [Pseudobutyrivibrio sp.]|nr:GNAT family N-acetyltransferase [Pseudobutyrivibrio sp.]